MDSVRQDPVALRGGDEPRVVGDFRQKQLRVGGADQALDAALKRWKRPQRRFTRRVEVATLYQRVVEREVNARLVEQTGCTVFQELGRFPREIDCALHVSAL